MRFIDSIQPPGAIYGAIFIMAGCAWYGDMAIWDNTDDDYTTKIRAFNPPLSWLRKYNDRIKSAAAPLRRPSGSTIWNYTQPGGTGLAKYDGQV